jgi:pSer/pThr/pTyr-binding forkhead associated (FHA) protein
MKTSPKPPPPTRLKVIDARGYEKVFLIDKDVFPIGREAVEGLALPDEEPAAIAARHALVIRDGNAYVLKDQSGSCGTRVNGRPIRSTTLKHGDRISLGGSTLSILFLVEGTRAADAEEARVRILLEVLRQLHSSLDSREIAARGAAGIMGILGSDWAALSLRAAGGGLEVVAALDRAGKLPDAASSIAHHVAATARSYFHPARLCVPIMTHAAGGGPHGVIDAGPRETAPYAASDMELLEALAEHVGVALANARLVESPASREVAAR